MVINGKKKILEPAFLYQFSPTNRIAMIQTTGALDTKQVMFQTRCMRIPLNELDADDALADMFGHGFILGV